MGLLEGAVVDTFRELTDAANAFAGSLGEPPVPFDLELGDNAVGFTIGIGLVAGVLIFIPVVAVLFIGLIGLVITSVVLFRQSPELTHN